MITFEINGKIVSGTEGETILEVAKRNGIDIPTLCNHAALEPTGACRMCTVEVTKDDWKGWKNYVVSCVYPIAQDIKVTTHSADVINIRRTIVELLLARCPDSKNLQAMAAEYGIIKSTYRSSEIAELRDNCILCGLCTRICSELRFSAISIVGRGHNKVIAAPMKKPPPDCTGCASCARICPTWNIMYKDENGKRRIWEKEFDMIACKECGKAYITEDYAKALMEKRGLTKDYFDVCDECKRKLTLGTIKNLVKWNEGAF